MNDLLKSIESIAERWRGVPYSKGSRNDATCKYAKIAIDTSTQNEAKDLIDDRTSKIFGKNKKRSRDILSDIVTKRSKNTYPT